MSDIEGKFVSSWNKAEKSFGSLKFAVIIILIFSVLMIIGTFVESYYGTEFAGRIVYKNPIFMLVQAGMFISIVAATFLRLPMKKRLYGFYVIHAGLVIIGMGSFITWFAGVDGSLTLYPNSPSREIVLPEDMLEIHVPDDNKKISYPLPSSAFSKNLDVTYEGYHFKRYYPYSDNVLTWKDSEKGSKKFNSGQFRIGNDNFSQDFTLSLNPQAFDFESSLTMGLLNIHYMPSSMARCFGLNNKSGYILWNSEELTCLTPEEAKLPIKKTNTGKEFFSYKYKDQILTFVPSSSPWPYNKEMRMVTNSPIKSFAKNMFKEKPTLFIMGKEIAFYHEGLEQWERHKLPESKRKSVELPWMGFNLRLLKHVEDQYPVNVPHYQLPIQKNGQLLRGKIKALEVTVQNKTYWLTNEKPLSLLIDGKKVNFYLTKKSIKLPFEFVLTSFKMDKDPGTNTPASYESFVKVFTENGASRHHIFMNNPFKHKGFTFYQASYTPLEGGQYSSTLSANVDQGRPFKYGGSLMLVLGSMWHYYLNRKRYRKKTKAADS
jgi:hypothetical protein